MKKKLLIIGGAGFIGHNIALKLKEDYEVFIIDSLAVNNFVSLVDNKDNLPYPKLSKAVLEDRIRLFDKNNLNITLPITELMKYQKKLMKLNLILLFIWLLSLMPIDQIKTHTQHLITVLEP